MCDTDLQRLEKVRKCFKISSYAEFSRILGLKNQQIFTSIKTKKNGISDALADSICKAFPEISYAWLKRGEGKMLRDATLTTNNDSTVSDNISVGNTTSQSDIDRWMALTESQQETINRQSAIISELTAKLAKLLPVLVLLVLMTVSLSGCKKERYCWWETLHLTGSEERVNGRIKEFDDYIHWYKCDDGELLGYAIDGDTVYY